MEYKRIIYKPGKVTQIIMNNPRRMNGISHPMYGELDHAFDRAAADEECRVIVHSGAGPCFSAGHDHIGSEASPMMANGTIPKDTVRRDGWEKKGPGWIKWREEHHYYMSVMKLKKWRNIMKPTIAMVHGYCILGGFFSAAAMDLIFASEDALFLPNFGNYDVAGWDIPIRKFREVVYEHRFMTAKEAYQCGFVNRVYPSREILEKETLAYANRVAENKMVTEISNIKHSTNYTRDIQGFPIAAEAAEQLLLLQLDGPPGYGGLTLDEHEEWLTATGITRSPRAWQNLRLKLEAEGEWEDFLKSRVEAGSAALPPERKDI